MSFERLTGGASVEAPVEVPDASKESVLAQKLELDGSQLTLLRFLPHVLIAEKLAPSPPDEPGPPALHLNVSSEIGQWETWLVPGSRLLGRMTVPPAAIECLPELGPDDLVATEELLQKLQSPEPKILLEVKQSGRKLILPVREKETSRSTDPDYAVEVLRLLKCFAMDPKTGQAIDQDPRPLNPAVQVRIEHAGQSRTAWLFSQYPDFSRGAEDETAAFRLVYPVPDHPHPRADVTLVDAIEGPLRLFIGARGSVQTAPLRIGETVKAGGLTFQLAERIPSARISQTVQVEAEGGPAVLLRWESERRADERWIALGAPEELRLGGRPEKVLVARLRSGSGAPHAGLPQGREGGSAPGSLVLPPGHPALRAAPPPAPPSRNGTDTGKVPAPPGPVKPGTGK